ncbi:hypothetical protein Dimus_009229 [Dionaea muscipula]
METFWRAIGTSPNPEDYAGVQYWSNSERAGWLTKQGEYIKTWRRRWFVLKQGKLFWFKDSAVTRTSIPRGVIPVATCVTVKGAEDVLNKPFAFQLSVNGGTMYFIADSEGEKEEWINSIGRSIVQHSRSVTESEVVDYDSSIKISRVGGRWSLGVVDRNGESSSVDMTLVLRRINVRIFGCSVMFRLLAEIEFVFLLLRFRRIQLLAHDCYDLLIGGVRFDLFRGRPLARVARATLDVACSLPAAIASFSQSPLLSKERTQEIGVGCWERNVSIGMSNIEPVTPIGGQGWLWDFGFCVRSRVGRISTSVVSHEYDFSVSWITGLWVLCVELFVMFVTSNVFTWLLFVWSLPLVPAFLAALENHRGFFEDGLVAMGLSECVPVGVPRFLSDGCSVLA